MELQKLARSGEKKKKSKQKDQNQMALRHWVARSGASGANTQIYFSKSVNIFRLTQKKKKKNDLLDSKVHGWLPGDWAAPACLSVCLSVCEAEPGCTRRALPRF